MNSVFWPEEGQDLLYGSGLLLAQVIRTVLLFHKMDPDVVKQMLLEKPGLQLLAFAFLEKANGFVPFWEKDSSLEMTPPGNHYRTYQLQLPGILCSIRRRNLCHLKLGFEWVGEDNFRKSCPEPLGVGSGVHVRCPNVTLNTSVNPVPNSVVPASFFKWWYVQGGHLNPSCPTYVLNC